MIPEVEVEVEVEAGAPSQLTTFRRPMSAVFLSLDPDSFNFFCSGPGISRHILKSYLYLYPAPGRQVVHPALPLGQWP